MRRAGRHTKVRNRAMAAPTKPPAQTCQMPVKAVASPAGQQETQTSPTAKVEFAISLTPLAIRNLRSTSMPSGKMPGPLRRDIFLSSSFLSSKVNSAVCVLLVSSSFAISFSASVFPRIFVLMFRSSFLVGLSGFASGCSGSSDSLSSAHSSSSSGSGPPQHHAHLLAHIFCASFASSSFCRSSSSSIVKPNRTLRCPSFCRCMCFLLLSALSRPGPS
mmetsp:Transcript_7235/g.12955  ORF Transcript_7235/g.12955 Transcript_7235/m.12955 type:complete len:218 (-) Transcript_7235:3476-4129(-)